MYAGAGAPVLAKNSTASVSCSGSSAETVTRTTPRPLYFFAKATSAGISSRHGSHQVAPEIRQYDLASMARQDLAVSVLIDGNQRSGGGEKRGDQQKQNARGCE